MPVKKDKNGQRSVEAEVEVPGTPEEVWRAIATGDGVSSWFVPSRIEGRVGGDAVSSFGPGMDAVSKITAWNPPHNYIAESAEAEGGAGKVATEWIVEARSGGTCVVRVVHRWFADTDDWDGEFEGHAYGWATSFFRSLQIYLSRFRGQPCAAFQCTAMSVASGPQTWRAIKAALRYDENTRRAESAPGTPELSGAAEDLDVTDPDLLRARERAPQIVAALEGMDGETPELLLRLDRPAPGIAHLFVMPLGEQAAVSMRFHLFGPRASTLAPEYESAWQAWIDKEFPNTQSPTEGDAQE